MLIWKIMQWVRVSPTIEEKKLLTRIAKLSDKNELTVSARGAVAKRPRDSILDKDK